MKNIIIATDTFEQVNGVSTTYKNILKVTKRKIGVVHPGLFKWKSMKYYPEIQICIQPYKVYKYLKASNPSHIHIATEGTIGLVARFFCKINKVTFTSGYHTKFPEYLNIYFKLPINIGYFLFKLFHKKSQAVLVPSLSCLNDLKAKGFNNLVLWTRGVDKSLISHKIQKSNSKKIKVLSVGRVSKEKNLEELCKYYEHFDITIVGEGPELEKLKQKYPDINFPGYKFGNELAKYYSQNDVFCFTSKTDTFGIVIIEALCNGLPIAAFNVTGPKDIVEKKINGFLSNNMYQNILKCKSLNRSKIKKAAVKKWSWLNTEKILFEQIPN